MSGRGTGDFWSLGRITAFFAAMTVVSFVVTGSLQSGASADDFR